MRIFNKKTLFCQIQDASLISCFISSFTMAGSTLLSEVSLTPLLVSGAILSTSVISAVGSGYIEHRRNSINDESIESEPFQVYKIISEEDFEEKEEERIFHIIEPAYTKQGNILSVDFEQISELKTESKKLTYKNRSN